MRNVYNTLLSLHNSGVRPEAIAYQTPEFFENPGIRRVDSIRSGDVYAVVPGFPTKLRK